MKSAPIRILVTGGAGQIGRSLAELDWPENVSLHLPHRTELDIGSRDSIEAIIATKAYAAVINSAAWTAVDAAEDEIGEAWLANAQGPAWLAEITRQAGIPLLHVSTDYVFGGDLDRPYREDDRTEPTGVYGASKLGGELAVCTGNPRSVVLRTAWVLSRHRGNFAKTMLRLAAERDTLSVVADQWGCPSSAPDIAAAIRKIVLRLITDPQAPTGVYHFVNAGEATWADLAEFVFREAEQRGGPSATVTRIGTADYPTRAARPGNSRLSTERVQQDFNIQPRDWHEAIAEVVGQILTGSEQEKDETRS